MKRFKNCFRSALIVSFLMLMTIFAIFLTVLPKEAQAANVQITWNANSDTDLAGYKVYYGTASKTYGAPIDVKNVTSYTLALTPATAATYYFAITAYDTSGNESAKSAEVSLFVPDANAPTIPSGVLVKILAAITAWLNSIGVTVSAQG